MNSRTRRIYTSGRAVVVTLPPDWLRGHDLGPGDQVEIQYDRILRIRPLKAIRASAAEERTLDDPAREPARTTETGERYSADAGD